MDSMFVELLTIGMCVVASGFFSGSETAFTRLRLFRAKEMADTGTLAGRAAWRIAQSPARMLGTILIGNNVVNIFAGAVASVVAVRALGEERGVAVATIGVTALLLIFAEVTPKSYAAQYPERVVRVAAIPLYLLQQVLAPVVRLLGWITQPMVRTLAGNRPVPEGVSASEIYALAKRLVAQGGATAPEAEIVTRVLEASQAIVGDVMQPRTEIFHVDEELTVAEAYEQFVSSRFSRAPVSRGGVDALTGFVHFKDVARRMRSNPEARVLEIARPVLHIPRTRPVLDILREVQISLTPVAVVLDEYGSTAGLVTTEDCMEEIVGEIRDEFDRSELAAIRATGEGEWLVLGHVRLADFARETGVALSTDLGMTFGGVLFNTLQRRVEQGDRVELDGFRLSANRVLGNRVVWVRLEQVRAADATDVQNAGDTGDAETDAPTDSEETS